MIAFRLALAGYDVVGIDPANAMLEVARSSPGGDVADWVVASAQDFRLDRTFNRILMNGNAFQVLLSEMDVQTTFRNMRTHLSEAGRIAFESRNPNLNWVERWNYDLQFETPSFRIGP